VFGVPIKNHCCTGGGERKIARRHPTPGAAGFGWRPQALEAEGTGRARQGSIRATQWKGGGKPFGPRPRKYDKRLPTEMRRAALREAVVAKLGAGELAVLEAIAVADAKTKTLVTRLRGLGIAGQPTLLVVSEVPEGLNRAARNVPWLSLETPGHVSVYQLIRNERVVFEKAALLTLQEALKP
jgi:large subunit ribosomal protein L4